MEVNGKIKVIKAMITNEAGTFSKRELVVTTEEQYPQDISIEFMQDKCDLLDLYHVGESVKVSINLRGREWTNPQGEVKYFNTIQGWKIAKNSTIQNPAAPATATPVSAPAKYVHTATDATYQAYKTSGWTDEQLVANGKGHFGVAIATAAPPVVAQQSEHDDLPF